MKFRAVRGITLICMIIFLSLLIWKCTRDKDESGDGKIVRTEAIGPMTCGPMLVNADFEAIFPIGSVHIRSYIFDSVNASLRINMEFQTINGDTLARSMILSPNWGTELGQGLITRIVDTNEELLWRLDIEFDTSNQDRVNYIEITNQDTLIARLFRGADTLRDEYVLNGNVTIFEYTVSEWDKVKSMLGAPSATRSKLVDSIPKSRITNLYVKAGNFLNSCKNAETLMGNKDGQLLSYLMTDEGFVTWIIPSINPEINPLRMPEEMEQLCRLATICTAVKCPEAINPVCMPCAALALACVAYEFVENLPWNRS